MQPILERSAFNIFSRAAVDKYVLLEDKSNALVIKPGNRFEILETDLENLFHANLNQLSVISSSAKYATPDKANMIIEGLKGDVNLRYLAVASYIDYPDYFSPLVWTLSYKSRLGSTLENMWLRHLCFRRIDIKRLCDALPFFSNLKKLKITGWSSYAGRSPEIYAAGLHAQIEFESGGDHPTSHGMLLLIRALKEAKNVAPGTVFRLKSTLAMVPNNVSKRVLERCFAAEVIKGPKLMFDSHLLQQVKLNTAVSKGFPQEIKPIQHQA